MRRHRKTHPHTKSGALTNLIIRNQNNMKAASIPQWLQPETHQANTRFNWIWQTHQSLSNFDYVQANSIPGFLSHRNRYLLSIPRVAAQKSLKNIETSEAFSSWFHEVNKRCTGGCETDSFSIRFHKIRKHTAVWLQNQLKLLIHAERVYTTIHHIYGV